MVLGVRVGLIKRSKRLNKCTTDQITAEISFPHRQEFDR